MHRDIKPQNVLIDHTKRTLKVVDFGLADFYFPEKDYSSKVASLYYKAPELLLGCVRSDYSVDVWAAGLILAGLVHPPINCRSSKKHRLCKVLIHSIRFTNCRGFLVRRR